MEASLLLLSCALNLILMIKYNLRLRLILL